MPPLGTWLLPLLEVGEGTWDFNISPESKSLFLLGTLLVSVGALDSGLTILVMPAEPLRVRDGPC